MMMNTIGIILTLTTFGESHGPAMGGVLDGVPAGVDIDLDELQRFVDRRRTGQTTGSSTRAEQDRVEVLSGIWQGKTLGTPIGFINHADYTWQAKYGIRDPRGGGRASARETVARVVAGGIAMQALTRLGITVEASFSPVDPVELERVAKDGDTLGGIISCVVKGVPAGLGEPVFGKLHAQLAAAMMSIPSVHGFEYGDGFGMTDKRGSEVMDRFVKHDDGSIGTLTNHSGGIQGGISNGEDITMRLAFKPVPTLMRPVPAIDGDGNPVTLQPRGRHDVWVLPRALPIVEAMAALVILDNYLIKKTNEL